MRWGWLRWPCSQPLRPRTARPARRSTETVEINAPADKVWAIIGNFQDMSWHPAVAKLEGSGGNDANATRTLTLKSGGTIEEKLLQNDAAKKTYKYEITTSTRRSCR